MTRESRAIGLDRAATVETADSAWTNLYRIGGAAALIAGCKG